MKIKRVISIIAASALALCLLAGCSSDTDSSNSDSGKADSTAEEGEKTESAGTEGDNEEPDEQQNDQNGQTASGSNILIAYFSVPEDIDISGIDADAGASVIVRDGEAIGNVQYMAQTIEQAVGGELFRIETKDQYPLDHDPLVDQAADEQDENTRPELSTRIENPEQYDIIFLGYPNWWGDMPQALYTFLEEYDFSEKMIIPFCPHGGSGFSRTESTIADLQPGAEVSSDGLSISRNDVADSADEVTAWAKGLGI